MLKDQQAQTSSQCSSQTKWHYLSGLPSYFLSQAGVPLPRQICCTYTWTKEKSNHTVSDLSALENTSCTFQLSCAIAARHHKLTRSTIKIQGNLCLVRSSVQKLYVTWCIYFPHHVCQKTSHRKSVANAAQLPDKPSTSTIPSHVQ